MEKKRIEFIDLAKGFCILLVVFIAIHETDLMLCSSLFRIRRVYAEKDEPFDYPFSLLLLPWRNTLLRTVEMDSESARRHGDRQCLFKHSYLVSACLVRGEHNIIPSHQTVTWKNFDLHEKE